MKVTVFRDIHTTSEGMKVQGEIFPDVSVILNRIKDGTSKELVESIRNETDKETRNNLKKRLPSICFSGRFSGRGAIYMLEHSGLITLDIDDINLKDLPKIKDLISKLEHTFSCFVSPSGNGLKVLVKIPASKSDHKGCFLALEKAFNELLYKYTSTKKNEKVIKEVVSKIDDKQGDYLRVHIDQSGKDVSRVCFESYDPDIYFNQDSEVWCEVLEETIVTKSHLEADQIYSRLKSWVDKESYYGEGNRNNYLSKFGYALCRAGLTIDQVKSCFRQDFSDFPENEIDSMLKSIYAKGEFARTPLSQDVKVPIPKDYGKKPITEFWMINDKGKVTIEVKDYLNFIEANGFGVYRTKKDPEKLRLVKVENLKVSFCGVKDVKDCVLNFVEKNGHMPVYNDMTMKNRYFEPTFLNALKEIEVEIIKDGKDFIYFFFEDFYYEVRAESIEKKTYPSLKGRHIWENQICKKTIKQIAPNFKKHDFNQFIAKAMTKGDKTKIDRYWSAVTSIGYGLHTYKKPSLAKLIYACDDVMSELDGGAEGGTGKNLLHQCMDFARSVVNVDGKSFDKRDKFNFQMVSEDTQLVFIDDYEGDIKELFVKVTGGFEIEKKGLAKTSSAFEDSPKLFVTSNSAPKGYSNSFKRRLHLVELSNYFNANNQPVDEFKKDFFSDDWNQDDWDSLYTFLFFCAQTYLKMGLVGYKSENLEVKQVYKNTNQTFAEFMLENTYHDLSTWVLGTHIWTDYKECVRDEKHNLTAQKFYSACRIYCKIMGFEYKSIGKGEQFKIKFEGWEMPEVDKVEEIERFPGLSKDLPF